MSTVEDIRGMLDNAKQAIPAASVQQARTDFEQVAQLIAHATDGSSNQEIQEAGQLARQAMDLMEQAQQIAGLLEQALDSYAARL